MTPLTVYVALSQFCECDDAPRRALLEAGFRVVENKSGRRMRREELLQVVGEADAVLAGVEPYDAELLIALPRLRCISRCGIGTDSIDLAAARQRQISVLTTEEEVIEPVAQMTVAMTLALARHFPNHCDDFRKGRWQKYTGYLLSEWTVGLVGFGRIGRAVERYLRPFGSRILVTDPNLDGGSLPDGVAKRDLTSLLMESDLVSLHAVRPQQEGPLLGRREIFCIKRGGRLVNTARGYLIDESALVEAIQSGHLSGAALDVFEKEPYTGPLAGLPQVLCTPHVATLTKASRTAMELRAATNVVAFFAGRFVAT